MKRTTLSFAIVSAALLITRQLSLAAGGSGELHRTEPHRVARAQTTFERQLARRASCGRRAALDLASAIADLGSSVIDANVRLTVQAWKTTDKEIDDHFTALNEVAREAKRALNSSLELADSRADESQPPLSPQLQALSARIHDVLAIYSEKQLNTAQHSPWEIMHRMVAFGIPTEIRRDVPEGDHVNAIGWLLWGGRGNGQPLLVLSNGRPSGRVGPGVQGHPAQFLGMLAQSEVSPASPFKLDGKSFTVADLIEQEKLDCSTNMELTFKLIALSYYVKSDETWTSQDGQKWSISRLIQEEIKQPLRTGACGGTHRLYGLSSAYLFRAKHGLPIDGEFQRAATYIRDYQRYTLAALQNPDGSLSTDWFNKPANAADPARKLQTTGHMLEWLVWSLPDEQLRDPRVVKSVDFIATTLADQPNHDWSVGPLGHALHALAIYDKRIHGLRGSKPEQFARRKAIYTSLLPSLQIDSPHISGFDVLPDSDSDRFVPRRATGSPADEGGRRIWR